MTLSCLDYDDKKPLIYSGFLVLDVMVIHLVIQRNVNSLDGLD